MNRLWHSGAVAGAIAPFGRALPPTGCVLAAVALWYGLTSWSHVIPKYIFPSPESVIAAAQTSLVKGYANATLLEHAWASTQLVLGGFAIGSCVAVVLACLMGYSPICKALINPLFQALRPIPPIAWIPISILWFGIGPAGKLFIISLAVLSPTLINTLTGIEGTDPRLIEAARVHGAHRLRVFFSVRLPSAVPMLFTGLRLGIQFAWMTLVAAELLGAYLGLGFVLENATTGIDTSMVIVGMLCVAALGAGMTLVLNYIESVVVRWVPAVGIRDTQVGFSLARELRFALIGSIGIFCVLVLWYFATQERQISRVMPSPAAVIHTIVYRSVTPFAGSTLPLDLFATAVKFFLAFVIAGTAGVLIGLLMGASKMASMLMRPFFEVFRFVPPIAWVPFAVLWFGATLVAPVFVVSTGVLSVCVVNTARGVRLVPEPLVEAARTLGASPPRRLFTVIAPASLPSIVAGIRIALGVGWASVIGAELIVGTTGLGYFMVASEENGALAAVVAGMVIIGFCGAILDLSIRGVERALNEWWA